MAGGGAFANGFATAFVDASQKKIDQAHQEGEQKKTELRNGLWKIAYDPNQPEAMRQNAQEQLQKLYGPEGKKGLQKFGQIFSKFAGGGQQQGQQQPNSRGPLPAPAMQQQGQSAPQGGGPAQPPPQASTPAPAAQPKQGGPLAAPQFQLPPTATDAQINASQDSVAQAATKRQLTTEGAEYDFWKEKGEKIGLKDRDLALYAGSKGQRLPPQEKRIADKGIARPGEDPSTGKAFEGLWDHVVEPDGSETWAKRPDAKGGQQIRSVPHSVSREDALNLLKQGSTFETQDGKEIDIENLPPNMGLQAMVSGNKMFWVPITPNQKTVTVGNVVYAATPYELKEIGQPGATGPTALGQARTGSSGTTAQLAVDPSTNKLTVNTLPRTEIPNTPGAQPAPQANTAPKQPAAPPARGPMPAPTAQPQGQGQPAQPKQADTGGATLRGAPVAMFNAQTQKAVPLMESVSQVFGDPAHPEIKPLLGYAELADDPKSSARLGKALKMTFDSLNEASGGGNVAVGAGPVSVSAGGIGTWLQNALGVRPAVADQNAKMMQKAIADLTPQEREAYDAEMTAFSTAVGLRSLTKASAAQGSVRAIERELPLIGVNVASSKQFYDQMQRLAELSINGVRTFPNVNGQPVGIDKGLADRIQSMPAQLKKLKDSTPIKGLAKPEPGKKPAPPKAGDVQDGYRFKGGDPSKQENWEPVKGKAAA